MSVITNSPEFRKFSASFEQETASSSRVMPDGPQHTSPQLISLWITNLHKNRNFYHQNPTWVKSDIKSSGKFAIFRSKD